MTFQTVKLSFVQWMKRNKIFSNDNGSNKIMQECLLVLFKSITNYELVHIKAPYFNLITRVNYINGTVDLH